MSGVGGRGVIMLLNLKELEKIVHCIEDLVLFAQVM
jgi:hypothetical protein